MTVIGNDWDEILQGEYGKDYFTRLMAAVDEEYARGTVYPPRPLVYSAMARVPYEKVRVVILGQDPYHGEGQANGMAFAVGKGVPLPPSLVNIFKEIESETGVLPNGSTLTGWASQGVLHSSTPCLPCAEHTPRRTQTSGGRRLPTPLSSRSPAAKNLWCLCCGVQTRSAKSRLSRRAILFSKAFTQVRYRRTAAFSAADISSKPTTSSFPARSRPSTGRTRTTTRRITIPTTAR